VLLDILRVRAEIEYGISEGWKPEA
jgi:hypothetical protein